MISSSGAFPSTYVPRAEVLRRRTVGRARRHRPAEVPRAPPGRPERQGENEADESDDHQDHADGVDVDPRGGGADGPGQDRSDGNQDQAHSDSHVVPFFCLCCPR
jgi:hypothetical protein